MMNINSLLDDMLEKINANSFFDDMKIIKAYPCSVKPTRLNNVYISLGINKIDIKPYEIDDVNKAGEVSVFADIFVPIRMDNACMSEIFSRLCTVLEEYNVIGISADRITADNDIQAYVLKTSITFSDEVIFGGEGNE
jgi:hypothetical protein